LEEEKLFFLFCRYIVLNSTAVNWTWNSINGCSLEILLSKKFSK